MSHTQEVPTKEQFLETIRLYASPMPAELLSKFTQDVLLLSSSKHAEHKPLEMAGGEIGDQHIDDLTGLLSLIKEVWLWRDTQIDEGAHSPAGRWLSSFIGMGTAWESLRQGRPLEDLSGHQAALARGLLKRSCLLKGSTKHIVSPSVIQEAFEVTAPPGLSWTIVILCALLEYHYDQDSAQRMIEEHKRLDDLETTAMRGFEAAVQIELISNTTWPAAAREAIPVRHYAGRARDAMSQALKKARAKVPPIKRLDETARERLLIFRLWQGHKSLFEESKPTAIANIVQAGRVENPDLDIKKIIKSFKEIPLDFDVRDIMPNARALVQRG